MKSTEIQPHEYAPFYSNYIHILGETTLLEALENSAKKFTENLENLPSKKLEYRYEEGKWTIKELIQHIIDAERVLSYRALRFSRNDTTNIPGFDEDWYVDNANGNERDIADLLNEFSTVRQASIALFKSFKHEMLFMKGCANNSEMTVRALGFVIAGHQMHHLKVIKEKYL